VSVSEVIATEKPATLVEAITEGLIRYIAAKRLRGGDRLPPERELVQMVGASRLPLREALCVLKGLGIIEAKHGKGLFVKQLDLATAFGMLSPLLRSQSNIDIGHIFEARMHLEGSIAELAAYNRSYENLKSLEGAVCGMRRNLADRPLYVRHDMAFHRELAHSTGNSIFHVFMASITDLLGELQFRYLDRVEVRHLAILEHEEILDAVRGGDGGRAKAAMERHLRNATERIDVE
jgi:GntR family transcriptional repressor for pyruvate dehydrogenase complex